MDLTISIPVVEPELKRTIKSLSVPSEQLPPSTPEDLATIILTLVRTGIFPDISNAHRISAVTALSCVLQARKTSDELKVVLADGSVWLKMFDLYLSLVELAKAKAVKSYLSVLITLLPTVESSAVVKDAVISKLTKSIFSPDDRSNTKSGLSATWNLLSKRAISIFDILERKDEQTCLCSAAEKLISTVLRWATVHELSPTAGQCMLTIWTAILREESFVDNVSSCCHDDSVASIWTKPLLETLDRQPDALPRFRSHVFPKLFNASIQDYFQFLEKLNVRSELSKIGTHGSRQRGTRRILLLTCLQVGKEEGIVEEAASSQNCPILLSEGKIMLRSSSLNHLMTSPSGDERFAALSVALASPSTTRPFTAQTLRVIKRILPIFFLESDAGLRGDITALLKNFLIRIRSVARKSKSIDDPHAEFQLWLFTFTLSELRPSAGYQRVVMALKTLELFMLIEDNDPHSKQPNSPSGDEYNIPTFAKGHSAHLRHMLLRLACNPFEDIRELSARLLVPTVDNDLSDLTRTIADADANLQSTGRADFADGFGRLNYVLMKTLQKYPASDDKSLRPDDHLDNSLLTALEREVRTARHEKYYQPYDSPLHGYLISLRYFVDDKNLWKDACSNNERTQRMLKVLQAVWDCVRGFLCVDSPEGHNPDDMDDFDAKDLLSQSWRALKEASALTSVMVTHKEFTDDLAVEKLCSLSFVALRDLRHRGAFSAVAQAFLACCRRLTVDKRGETLDNLYLKTMECLQAQGSKLTRRSAGLPSMLLGLLCANPTSNLFQRAMADLMDLAATAATDPAEGGNLPQVHAMNCLQTIFTSSALGPSSESYIPKAIQLAGDCLSSEIWAIRNCGLMLFRSLIDRLTGSTEGQLEKARGHLSGSRVSWNDIPTLADLIQRLLSNVPGSLTSSAAAVESVFLALKMIERIPPPISMAASIRQQVLSFCDSSHWHVRSMAARTFASLSDPHNLEESVRMLLSSCQASQNRLHGRLLSIFAVIDGAASVDANLILSSYDAVIALLQVEEEDDFVLTTFISNHCPYTRTAFVNIYNLLYEIALQNDEAARARKLQPSRSLERAIKLDWMIDDHGMTSHLRSSIFLHQVLTLAMVHILDPISFHAGWIDQQLWGLISHDANAAHILIAKLTELIDILPKIIASQVSNCLESRLYDAEARENLEASASANGADTLDSDGFKTMSLDFIGATLSMHPQLERLDSPEYLKEAFSATAPILPPGLMASGLVRWACAFEQGVPDLHCKDVVFLLGMIRYAMADNQTVSIREKVVTTLRPLASVLKLSRDHRGHRMAQRLYMLLLYDCLNDDDEDTRLEAAAIVPDALKIAGMGRGTESAMPLLSSYKIAKAMTCLLPESVALAVDCMERITGTNITIVSAREIKGSTSAEDQFRECCALKTSGKLFQVEKQNLYRDDVRETEVWSNVLGKMRLRDTTCLDWLRQWVETGLRAIRSELVVFRREENAPHWPDWMLKDEFGLLFHRIMNAAHAVCSGDSFLKAGQELLDLGLPWDLEQKLSVTLDRCVQGRLSKHHKRLHGVMEALSLDFS